MPETRVPGEWYSLQDLKSIICPRATSSATSNAVPHVHKFSLPNVLLDPGNITMVLTRVVLVDKLERRFVSSCCSRAMFETVAADATNLSPLGTLSLCSIVMKPLVSFTHDQWKHHKCCQKYGDEWDQNEAVPYQA